MNKTAVFVVIGIIVVGLAIAVLTKSKSEEVIPVQGEEQAGSVATASEAGSGMATGRFTLKEVLVSGAAQECNFSDANGSSGTVYVANGKMRGDFTSTAGDAQVASHMVVQNEMSNVWTDGTDMGITMSIANVEGNTSGSVNVDTQYDFTCKSWNVDEGKFALPTDVKFSVLDMPSGIEATVQ